MIWTVTPLAIKAFSYFKLGTDIGHLVTNNMPSTLECLCTFTVFSESDSHSAFKVTCIQEDY